MCAAVVRIRIRALIAMSFGISVASVEGGPVFHGIGDLPGGSSFSRVFAVSADGLVAVGHSWSASGLEAFRWSRGEGIVGLGDLPGGEFRSDAFDVSADGSVIVGSSRSSAGPLLEAFRWQGGVMNGLGDFDGGSFASIANAVSANGQVVGGAGTHATGGEAFAWNSGTGLVALGDLPGGSIASTARGMSASGAVIVGSSQTGNLDGEAFRWTQEIGMEGLGFLEGGDSFSGASAVSSDGTVVAGRSDALIGSGAFRWTESSGMMNLGEFFRPKSLSGDGAIIVGSLWVSSVNRQAVLWSEDAGLQNLKDVLESDYSLDLSGWTLESATDISVDGKTIVGFGTNPFGQTEGWIAVVPEPTTLVLLAAGMCLLRHGRLQRH